MKRWLGRLLLVLALLGAAAGARAADEEGLSIGLQDEAELLPAGTSRVIDEQLQRLHHQTGVKLAVVLERCDPRSDDEEPLNAGDWLASWGDHATRQQAKIGVLHVNLSKQKTTVAMTPLLAAKLDVQVVKSADQEVLQPALKTHSTGELGRALQDVVRRLVHALGVADEEPVAPGPVRPAVIRLEVQPIHPWLSAWWLVVLPSVMFWVLLGWREGWLRAALLAPLLVLLYLGLYCLVRFRPSWFMVTGAAAVLPLLMAVTAQPPAPRARAVRRRGLRAPLRGGGGFGVTGLTAWGAAGRR